MIVTRVGPGMREGFRGEIVQYVESHHGRPWAAAVFYASDDLTLFFVSEPDSRHCTNLRNRKAFGHREELVVAES